MKSDLHLHTTASDGQLTPVEIVGRAAHLGLSVIAITDHDSIDGVQSAIAAAENSGVLVIPGVEISTTTSKGEAHILGYFIDHRHPGLLRALGDLRASRRDRGRKIVARLGEMGVRIDWERVLQLASGGIVGRPHIAQAMLEQGHISTFKEAFVKYIARGAPAYVERKKLTPAEAITVILEADGLPFLAHPGDINDVESFARELKRDGIVGLEVYYGTYPPTKIARLKALADRCELMASGGSDYHGLDEAIGSEMGHRDIPRESLERLILHFPRQTERLSKFLSIGEKG
jgi:predicted metal-dependent phosphoesterase TrpH